MEGTHCCRTAKENVFMEIEELNDSMTTEKPLCDGGWIRWNRMCCENNDFQKCPGGKKCRNGKGTLTQFEN